MNVRLIVVLFCCLAAWDICKGLENVQNSSAEEPITEQVSAGRVKKEPTLKRKQVGDTPKNNNIFKRANMDDIIGDEDLIAGLLNSKNIGGETKKAVSKETLFSVPRLVAIPVERVIDVYKNPKYTLYDVLGLRNTASLMDIKKSFRKLALKIHPDKNSHPYSGEALSYLRESYATLSNENERRQYDLRLRQKALKRKKNGWKNTQIVMKNKMENINARMQLAWHRFHHGQGWKEVEDLVVFLQTKLNHLLEVIQHFKLLPSPLDQVIFLGEVLLSAAPWFGVGGMLWAIRFFLQRYGSSQSPIDIFSVVNIVRNWGSKKEELQQRGIIQPQFI